MCGIWLNMSATKNSRENKILVYYKLVSSSIADVSSIDSSIGSVFLASVTGTMCSSSKSMSSSSKGENFTLSVVTELCLITLQHLQFHLWRKNYRYPTLLHTMANTRLSRGYLPADVRRWHNCRHHHFSHETHEECRHTHSCPSYAAISHHHRQAT